MGGMHATTNDVTGAALPDELLDSAAIAQRLGVTERFIRRLVDERRVPFIKIGRFVRFDASTVEQWLAEQRVEPLRGAADRVSWWR